MLDPSIIDALVASGCTVAQLAAVVRADAVVEKGARQEELLSQRQYETIRKREYRQKKAEQIQQPCPVVSPGQTGTNIASIEEKEESKEVSKQEKEVSNRRVSKKRSKIPLDLLCSARNVADANKIGLLEPDVAIEWPKFHDHHLHKGTLGLDWDAGWRRWCQNFISWKGPKNGTQGNIIPAIDQHLTNLRAAKARFDGHDQPRIRNGTLPFTLRLLSEG